jgi:hypothetical protein
MRKVLRALESRVGGRSTAAVFVGMLLGVLLLAGPAIAAVFSNSGPISVPTSGTATPYPQTVDVSGLSGKITDLNVTLHGVTHSFPDDLEVLLVGPGGQKVLLMSDVGGRYGLNGVDLTFDDEAAGKLPDNSQITAGSYMPTRGTGTLSFSSPAPSNPYATSLSAFDGADPNGTYSLYVYDDTAPNAGQIAGGFSLDIQTAEPPADLLPDLRMASVNNVQIRTCADTSGDCAFAGQRQLRFDAIIVNVGAGDLYLRGSRPDTSSPMTVYQRIFNSAGGYRERATNAEMYYAGDGHNHWHVRYLERYELIRLDNGVKEGNQGKEGFCFADNYKFGSTQPAAYNGSTGSCGSNRPDAQGVHMGLSRGWGDIYRTTTVDQYIDITNLNAGSYRLEAIADEDGWFEESDETNNVTWVDLQITGNSVSVTGWGPAAQPIGT